MNHLFMSKQEKYKNESIFKLMLFKNPAILINLSNRFKIIKKIYYIYEKLSRIHLK